MGAREAKGKKFDDKGLKFFNGKEIGEEFRPLAEFWERLLLEENATAKENFLTYWKDANLQLRIDEMNEYETQKLITRGTGFFITPNKYKLTPEYNLNDQYDIFLDCENLKQKNLKSAEQSVTERVKEINKSENKAKSMKIKQSKNKK